MDLDQVNVFRITNGLQMELEKRGAAPESQVVRQDGIADDLHKGAADDQVLFHLIVLGPGGRPSSIRK